MKHLSLRIRLTVAFLLLALLVGTVNFYQIQSLRTINDQLRDIHQSSTATERFSDERQMIIQSLEKSNNIAILMTGLVICVAALLGLIIASRIASSLDRVKKGAQRIANGNLSEVISVSSRDEIGQLADSFNQMSIRLRDSYNRLAVEKQRDETILENMGEGLIAVDENAKIVLMNNVAAMMLDLGGEETTIGKELYPLFELYKENKKKTAVHQKQHPVFEVLREGKPINDIFGFHKKENRSILINFNTNPIILEGEVVGAIVVLRDVTHEREVDRMKTEFISLASHQLRTPLSAIKWFSEMLLSGDAGKLKDEQADFAKNIADSTERMIELVNSLLNISRIESGRIMIDPKPTDLRELVSGIVTDLKAKTEERQQALIVSVHSGLPKINLDPRLIGQVYLNLLTNAIKYTPKGGEISVFISKKGDEVVSQVTDNGYGIPKAQQARVFQKFFRAENVAKVETDGTGLGLYLIKAIIESSGGKIWFKSEENKGTTFWFSIPLSGMKPKEGEVTLDG
jgi:signal transduction histidine kinase